MAAIRLSHVQHVNVADGGQAIVGNVQAGGAHGDGNVNPAYKHRMRGRKWVEMRQAISDMLRKGKEIERLIE
jgi:hypothetical protein